MVYTWGMTTNDEFDRESASEALFLPLADPARREADPLRALSAARALRVMLDVAQEFAVVHAVRAGCTWDRIGEQLGVNGPAAEREFGRFVSAMLLHEPDDTEAPAPVVVGPDRCSICGRPVAGRSRYCQVCQ